MRLRVRIRRAEGRRRGGIAIRGWEGVVEIGRTIGQGRGYGGYNTIARLPCVVDATRCPLGQLTVPPAGERTADDSWCAFSP